MWVDRDGAIRLMASLEGRSGSLDGLGIYDQSNFCLVSAGFSRVLASRDKLQVGVSGLYSCTATPPKGYPSRFRTPRFPRALLTPTAPPRPGPGTEQGHAAPTGSGTWLALAPK